MKPQKNDPLSSRALLELIGLTEGMTGNLLFDEDLLESLSRPWRRR